MFLENHRDFCCLSFKKVLSLLYTPSRTACRYWYRQMIAHDCPIEQSTGRVATSAQTSGWHLWTVIIPRRSISGKLVSGQVWRRRHGAKWAYKKFVEWDVTGNQLERSPMSNPVIKATMMLSVAATSTFTVFVFSWIGLALLGF